MSSPDLGDPGVVPVEAAGSAAAAASRARAVGGTVMAIAGVLLLLQLSWIVQHCDALSPMAPGDPVPRLALPRADGRGVTELASLRGKVVLVDFWATWCAPCRALMPTIETLHRRHGPAGLEIYSINTDGGARGAAAARAFAVRAGLGFPVVLDDGSASAGFKVDSIPHLVLVDREGRIRALHQGGFRLRGIEATLDAEIRRLLAEPAAGGAQSHHR